jgi:hypothetical protein
MGKVYLYVVARDFGFAPNPFHGCCTLATCKPGIRSKCELGDWVVGMGGRRLNATSQCVFAMRVSRKLTFDQYWSNPEYFDKRPVRNGTSRMLVGDNIYHHDKVGKAWCQADSHHSNADGTANLHNLRVDTSADAVLVSDHFFYFGSKAPEVPGHFLESIGYKNGRKHRVFDEQACRALIDWINFSFGSLLNMVAADPFDFAESHRRYSARDNKIT